MRLFWVVVAAWLAFLFGRYEAATHCQNPLPIINKLKPKKVVL